MINHRPPRLRHCRHGCGAAVHQFVEAGVRVQVDAEQVSPLVNLNRFAPGELWEWRGQWVGWVALWQSTGRTWRPLHAEHRCPGTPRLHDQIAAPPGGWVDH